MSQRKVKQIEPRKVKVGYKVTLYPDGSNGFTVKQLMAQGWRYTFITETGIPVDVTDTDELYLIE